MPPFSSLHLYVYVFLPSFRSDAKSYGGLSIALADGYSAHSSPPVVPFPIIVHTNIAVPNYCGQYISRLQENKKTHIRKQQTNQVLVDVPQAHDPPRASVAALASGGCAALPRT